MKSLVIIGGVVVAVLIALGVKWVMENVTIKDKTRKPRRRS